MYEDIEAIGTHSKDNIDSINALLPLNTPDELAGASMLVKHHAVASAVPIASLPPSSRSQRTSLKTTSDKKTYG